MKVKGFSPSPSGLSFPIKEGLKPFFYGSYKYILPKK
jgi:hypothetical protein